MIRSISSSCLVAVGLAIAYIGELFAFGRALAVHFADKALHAFDCLAEAARILPDIPAVLRRESRCLTTGLHRHALPRSLRPDADKDLDRANPYRYNDNGSGAFLLC